VGALPLPKPCVDLILVGCRAAGVFLIWAFLCYNELISESGFLGHHRRRQSCVLCSPFLLTL